MDGTEVPVDRVEQAIVEGIDGWKGLLNCRSYKAYEGSQKTYEIGSILGGESI